MANREWCPGVTFLLFPGILCGKQATGPLVPPRGPQGIAYAKARESYSYTASKSSEIRGLSHDETARPARRDPIEYAHPEGVIASPGGFLQPTSVEIAKHLLYMVGAILLFGIASTLVARKVRVPDVAVFLLVGIALGPGVSGVVSIGAGSAANQLLLLFGSCYILFDGGASLRLRVLK